MAYEKQKAWHGWKQKLRVSGLCVPMVKWLKLYCKAKWSTSCLTRKLVAENVCLKKQNNIRERRVWTAEEMSVSVEYNVGINDVIHRQTVARIGSFLWPGTQTDRLHTNRASATIQVAAWSKDYRAGLALLPTTSQIAYSMWKACAHWAKISDYVEEFQEALNNSIVLGLNGSIKRVYIQHKQL